MSSVFQELNLGQYGGAVVGGFGFKSTCGTFSVWSVHVLQEVTALCPAKAKRFQKLLATRFDPIAERTSVTAVTV